jgi:homoserine O-acetyltransferase
LDGLGVKHLVAVAGPSYGGYQAFQWAVSYPDFMDTIVPVVTAPKAQGNVEQTLDELQACLASDPEWNSGWYYDRGGAKGVLTDLRVETLKRYGSRRRLPGVTLIQRREKQKFGGRRWRGRRTLMPILW